MSQKKSYCYMVQDKNSNEPFQLTYIYNPEIKFGFGYWLSKLVPASDYMLQNLERAGIMKVTWVNATLDSGTRVKIPKVEYTWTLSAIIAVCNLVDCCEIKSNNGCNAILKGGMVVGHEEFCFGDYTPGRFAWITEDVKRLEKPIPEKGRLGLWDYDLEAVIK